MDAYVTHIDKFPLHMTVVMLFTNKYINKHIVRYDQTKKQNQIINAIEYYEILRSVRMHEGKYGGHVVGYIFSDNYRKFNSA